MSRKPRRAALTATRRPRCAILARVSRDVQHLDAQTTALVAEAARRGFDVVETIEDTGTGKRMDERAGLRRAMELAEAREIDVLLVAELSRVGRNLAGVAEVVDRLSRLDVALVSLREHFDISSPVGRLLVGILASVAAFETDLLAQRTSAGLAAAAARGRAVGAAPYGTAWVIPEAADAPAALVAVPEELETLRRARALRESLGSWTAAAAALSADGRRTRKGTAWTAGNLAAACRNERAAEVARAAG